MSLSVLVSALGGIVVLCAAAARVPAALADLLRACIPTLHAARELKHAWRTDTTLGTSHAPRQSEHLLPHPTRRHLDGDFHQGNMDGDQAARRHRSGEPT
ncbi:hypothetical protein [Streptomyces sp. NPDC020951]|uniref:hypothetical protein n=1 Tax=Streptomyces sp. NPDC020951 TaxID=3365104 RepID=UPI0037A9B5F6